MLTAAAACMPGITWAYRFSVNAGDSYPSCSLITFTGNASLQRDRGMGMYVWPGESRPSVRPGKARFHAKALIADRSVAFVSSANLTGAAIDSNIELGLFVAGGFGG